MSDNAKGVLWALVAAALFSVASVMAKLSVGEYGVHVLQVLFVRQLVVFLSSLPAIAHAFPHSLRTRRPGLHAVRILGAFVALSCGIWSVALLPLTMATTLAFSKVFFVSILALAFLKEPVGPHRFGAVVIGFAGVVVIMRPGVDGLVEVSSLVPVIGALGAAVAVISVRRLSQTESTATLLVYQSFVVGLMAGVPMIWLWQKTDAAGIALLVAIGVISTLGQLVGIQALQLGEASVIGNAEYTKLIHVAVLGYLLFAEIPGPHTMIGAVLIVGSSVHILHQDARTARPSRQHS